MTYERINFVDQSVERPRTYEMTHNSDGSVTFVDSFGLVDELGTPINADTMNHIEDGIANNDNRITYLEDRQIVDYRIQNMLTTGSVSTDEQGYNQLEDMYHSTFDLSKFEVVGSPNITSDGVASGFSNVNYLTTQNADFTSIKTFKIDVKFTTVAISTGRHKVIFHLYNSNNPNTIKFYERDGFRDLCFNIPVSDSTYETVNMGTTPLGTHTASLRYNGSSLTIYIDDVLKVTREIDIVYVQKLYNLLLGTSGNDGNAQRFTGSIDLKQFSITVDGKEVFNGNKTGLDVIKPDDYTVVGSPNITSDGVASGFGGSSCVKPVNITELVYQANSWEINVKFTTGTVVNSTQAIIGDALEGEAWKPRLTLDTNGRLGVLLSTASGNWQINFKGTSVLNKNTTYYIKIVFTGTMYQLFISNDGENFVLDGQTENSTKIINSNYLNTLGANTRAGELFGIPFNGSIDLNAFKIYVDGNLVYQPCLKIPYSQSKTGSKIVDVVYRDRVQDVFEQYGQAEYYTIDEDNKNFTLPMGEIYGMMVNKDLSNVEPSQSFIDKIIEYNSIDYSSGIEISFPVETAPFTAPTAGVYITNVNYNTRSSNLYINGIKTAIRYVDSDNDLIRNPFTVRLSKGDVIYWGVVLKTDSSAFYPLKGAK